MNQPPPFQIRHCPDHRQCWLIRQLGLGNQYVMFMHITAPFRYAIDVVDRAVQKEA